MCHSYWRLVVHVCIELIHVVLLRLSVSITWQLFMDFVWLLRVLCLQSALTGWTSQTNWLRVETQLHSWKPLNFSDCCLDQQATSFMCLLRALIRLSIMLHCSFFASITAHYMCAVRNIGLIELYAQMVFPQQSIFVVCFSSETTSECISTSTKHRK